MICRLSLYPRLIMTRRVQCAVREKIDDDRMRLRAAHPHVKVASARCKCKPRTAWKGFMCSSLYGRVADIDIQKIVCEN